jgi:hypothetical protein
LPLFELGWQRLKSGPRQHSLPKVRFVINRLPKDFSVFSERGKPFLPVKLILAVVFIWQCGKLLWQTIAFQHKIRYALREEVALHRFATGLP